jgi:toxin ParE1/3/4
VKRVNLRTSAENDIDDALDHYAAEAGQAVALRFATAVEAAVAAIAAYPSAGSPRYAHRLEIPELRCQSLRGFPYMIFYVELDHSIEAWRVLHGARDIPASFAADS